MREWLLIVCACSVAACSTGSSNDAPAIPQGGTAGTDGVSSGGSPASSGGLPASGGSPAASGGSLSSGGGGALAAGSGGAPYDPDEFDWPEATQPEGACEAGTYEGTFTCDITFIPGFPPGQVTGPITFALTPSVNGEFLEIKDGRMDAVAVNVPFGSDLNGKLDCSTRVLHADTLNGSFGTAPLTGEFYGSLEGKLDGLTSTLNGTWTLNGGTMAAPSPISCQGTWSAVKH